MKHDYQDKPILAISDWEENAIKQCADQVGKHIGEAVSDLMTGIMFSILATKQQADSQINSSKPKDIMKVAEIADILRISNAKAYRLIQRGEIPALKINRTTRVRRQDLDEFIKEHLK